MMLAGLVLALSFGVGAPGQAPAAVPPVPSPVRLDVVVTDAGGRRVSTLTAADFTVTEAGERRPVDGARFVAPVPAASPGSAASERLFAILLDDFHVSAGAAAERIRAELVRFVRDDLGPLDRVVVLRPLDSLLAIALSTDKTAALAAIAAFEPRRGDFTPRSDFERTFIAESPARVAATRARIVTSAMNALALHLGQFPNARKSLIVVSEGFAAAPRRDAHVDPTLRSVVATANRANVAIYTMNPLPADASQPTDGAEAQRRDALRALAADTGGLNFESVDDPRPALRAVQADAEGFYVVTFTPPADQDGRLEAIDVAVAGRGLTVRAPRAYGRPARPRPVSPPLASFLSAYSARFPRHASPLIRPWFGLTRGDGGQARINFVWEPSPRVPGDRSSAGPPARIAMVVTTLDGEPVFDGVVLPATGSITGRGEGMRAVFDAPAGRLLVQMSIMDLSNRVLDRDVRDVVVGGFPGPVSLGTAEIFRARTAREIEALLADPDAVPVAARQFSRRERLIVRVPVYGAGTPSVSAKLVSAFGSVMRETAATALPAQRELYQVDFALSPFAPGHYTIDIEAHTAEGTASDRLAVRITP